MKSAKSFRVIEVLVGVGCTVCFVAAAARAQQPNGSQAHQQPMAEDRSPERAVAGPDIPTHKPVTNGPSFYNNSSGATESGQNEPAAPNRPPPFKDKDIKCMVLNWEPRTPKPALSLMCPPRHIYAPLRVYLKFSWLKPEDIPKDVEKIAAETRSETKIRLQGKEASVWLPVAEKGSVSSSRKWVVFNNFLGIALTED